MKKALLILLTSLLFGFSISNASADETCAVSQKADAKWNACKEYTYDKKNEFKSDVQSELAKVDAQMTKIQKNIKKGTVDAQFKGRQRLDDIRAERDTVSKKLNEVSKSTKSAWDDMEKGVRSAVDDLTHSVKKAKEDYK